MIAAKASLRRAVFIRSQQENPAINGGDEQMLLSINHNIPRLKSRGSSRLIFFLILLIFFPHKSQGYQWQELSSEHFIIYFLENKDFAQEVLDKAEVYYRNIALQLGYPRYSEFWTWENRVKIYIYPDRDSFQKATGQPTWSEGMASYNDKQIMSYAWSKGFTESLLPHEMAHLIFRDFVRFKGAIPLWLDEGVAQWMEEPKRPQIKRIAKKYFQESSFLCVEDMMRLDIRNLKYAEAVYIRPTRTKEGGDGILFLSAELLINTYYIESVSLVGFLIEKYGSSAFADFCRELRDGKNVEEALRSAYPAHIRNLREFEDRWREYLEAE
jgi:hypothetical protein